MLKMLLPVACTIALTGNVQAQNKALTNTAHSKHAVLYAPGLGEVKWTQGFWAERFNVCKEVMVPGMWNIYMDAQRSHAFKNFEIAAGLDTGAHKGPSFHDGDFYKTLEAMAAMYAATHDPQLDLMMDRAIGVIAKGQRDDGYIYTKSVIEQKRTGSRKQFDDRLSFEAYNIGHLMTAACVHFRATGKTSLLQVAKKAGDFLIGFYTRATPEQARNAICPSHYMGIIELYRTTQEAKYLTLAQKLIDIRGLTEGTDDNSDRAPFRQMQKVAGHAVRANYLFAGVADVYTETGDSSLLPALNSMWDNVVNHKMYVTGGCGALYDGVSVDGASYNPDTVQKVHQSYGKDYQLPNLSAHNETCANIGNVLWNWRMLQMTGDGKYADIVELALYNSVLSGVSMDGSKYFYTNPLAASKDYPYQLRWMGGRQEYIGLSNCCPPNTVRTVAEVSNYVYSLADSVVQVNLYGGSELTTTLPGGRQVRVKQVTNYPWDGRVRISIEGLPANYAVRVRIPGWCRKYSLAAGGSAQHVVEQGYAVVRRHWEATDEVVLDMDMPATLLESHHLVEETRNQVAVKRGPVVYCLESPDMAGGASVFDVAIPVSTVLKPVPMQVAGGNLMALKGQGKILTHAAAGGLYREVATKTTPISLTLIPYYAWANRGATDMTVWMPVMR
ncbi:glycoside hydrolase family 127 protein [Paraflavitalea sp. CAU 1676]|uniref:aceric acid hydrolase n=1 Tax=Paraflavitalea sp. CAU 1676 TaxID=3032598 RepID=UPI0023DA8FAF|nr:glycoside hydrolase family 127 protein [Paraflavitalea sp. CAU 1676]MDF2190449.1 glycoside hydrolase family 127 protein [Paraflavitalea sp. CAU 1676]